MPAYIVAQMKVHDIETYRECAGKVAPTFAAFGGKLLAANDDADVREGTQPFPRTVLVEFPDMEAARGELESLNDQAVEVRYPGNVADLSDANEAIETSRKIRDRIRAALALE